MNIRYTFPRSCRLLKTDEYSSVFNFRCGKSGKYLNVYAKPNINSLSPRLGIVVGKKQLRTAVARNFAKRVVRDTFRINRNQLPNLDYIVRINKPFSKAESNVVRNELMHLFNQSKRCLES
jgi:ribonuclease P protein component